MAAAVAAATHLGLLQFIPRHIAPMVPQSFWVLVAVMASVVAFSADRVSNAWQSSGVARAWRALRID